jgi:hypothetical protein
MCKVRGLVGRGEGDVESPHILAGSFRANKSGCRISRGKDGQCGGGEEARPSQKIEGVGRWREENGIRKNQGQTKRVQGKVGVESEGGRRMYVAVRMDPLERVKGMGGSVAGRMRWVMEGSTDSRRRTCVAPESAMMGGRGDGT